MLNLNCESRLRSNSEVDRRRGAGLAGTISWATSERATRGKVEEKTNLGLAVDRHVFRLLSARLAASSDGARTEDRVSPSCAPASSGHCEDGSDGAERELHRASILSKLQRSRMRLRSTMPRIENKTSSVRKQLSKMLGYDAFSGQR